MTKHLANALLTALAFVTGWLTVTLVYRLF